MLFSHKEIQDTSLPISFCYHTWIKFIVNIFSFLVWCCFLFEPSRSKYAKKAMLSHLIVHSSGGVFSMSNCRVCVGGDGGNYWYFKWF